MHLLGQLAAAASGACSVGGLPVDCPRRPRLLRQIRWLPLQAPCPRRRLLRRWQRLHASLAIPLQRLLPVEAAELPGDDVGGPLDVEAQPPR